MQGVVMRAFLCGVALFLGCGMSAAAAPERWMTLADTVFQHIGPDQGLPHPVVTAMEEDGDGFLWVGTQGGLTRWDGYRFKTYKPDPMDPHALPDNWVLCLHTDHAGRLWIGTNSGGVVRYDRNEDQFTLIGASGAQQLSNPAVYAIAEDGQGGLWFGTDGGVDHFDPETGQVTHLRHDAGDQRSIPDDRVRSLLLDDRGGLWVGTRGGLAYRAGEAAGFVPVPLPAVDGAVEIWSLFQDSAGAIWIGTTDHGAYVLDRGAVAPRAVTAKGGDLDSFGQQWVWAIAEVAPGRIWLGTYGQGIVAVDKNSGVSTRLRRDPTRPSSLANDQIWSLHRDRSGMVWVGSTAGLSRFDATQSAILSLFGGTRTGEGLSAPGVLSVMEARDGRVWVGTHDNGVDILDPRGVRVEALRPDPGRPQTALPRAFVLALVQADDGTIFLGTNRGLYKASADGRQIARLTVAEKNPELPVWSLALAKGVLWVGGNEDGLWRYDVAAGKTTGHWGSDDLTDQRVQAIAPEGTGQVWIGTRNGLNRLDVGSGKIEKIPADAKNPQALPAGYVSTLLHDERGQLWVGTVGGGIAILDGRDQAGRPTFRRIDAGMGLPDDNIDKLFLAKTGQIWGSTDNGLAVIDPQSYAVRALRRAEGAAITGYFARAGAMTAHGELLFGGVEGLTVVRPQLLQPWRYKPAVVITELRVGGNKNAKFDGGGELAPLTTSSRANSLAVEFAALDYSAPERNRYAYRLDGFDKNWIETDATRRLAAYTNLPPGSYTLRLKGSNRDGVWSEQALALPLSVLPAWYQTLWFRMLLALTACAAVYGLVRGRTAYLLRQRANLERLIAERTEELRASGAKLHAARQSIAALLDNSGQGFLSFGADMVVDQHFSRACKDMLGCVPANRKIDELLFPDEPGRAEFMRRTIASAVKHATTMVKEQMLSLLPRGITRELRTLAADYKFLEDSHVMLVLTDVTEQRRLAAQVEDERRRQSLIVAAVAESQDFFDTIDDFKTMIERPGTPSNAELFRTIHTFKGSFGQLGFKEIPGALDRIEALMPKVNGTMPADTLRQLLESEDWKSHFERDLAPVRAALGEDYLLQGSRYFLTREQGAHLKVLALELIGRGSSETLNASLKAALEALTLIDGIDLRDALRNCDRAIQLSAHRENKLVDPLIVEGGSGVRLDGDRYRDLVRSLVHIFRNCVAHGIEEPITREEADKPRAGVVRCRIDREEDRLTIAISDDGAGIDLDALRRKAVEAGLFDTEQAAALPDDEAMALVFRDFISTRETADDLAGRGVGLAAVDMEVRKLGGRISVSSVRGQGSTFVISLPYRAADPVSATGPTA